MAQDDIQGTVTDSAGDPVQGAVVALIPNDGSDGDDVLYTTTDSNGDYIFDGHPQGDGTTQEWHVMARYDDGSGQFNSLSLPYVSADLPELATIPDSEAEQKLIHRWVLDDVETGTAVDSQGSSDGTVNGVANVDGDWLGGSAGDGDGTDDFIDVGSTTLGSTMADCAVAFSVKSGTSYSSTANFLGLAGENPNLQIFTGLDTTSGLEIQANDSNGDTNRIATSSNNLIDDGNPHRVVCNFPTMYDSNTWEIWLDQSDLSVSIKANTQDSGNSYGTFPLAVYLFARNGGSDENHWGDIIDDVCFFDTSLTQSEIESYQNPWE